MAESRTYWITVGTSFWDFDLLDEDEVFDASGITVGIIVKDANGVAVTSSPTVAWLNQAQSSVRVSGINNLSIGQYTFRYTLTDGSGNLDYVPRGVRGGSPDTIIITAT